MLNTDITAGRKTSDDGVLTDRTTLSCRPSDRNATRNTDSGSIPMLRQGIFRL